MPRGQASTTWFPELKVELKNKWIQNLGIKDHFEIVKVLNVKLGKIRRDLKVKPMMFRCHCSTEKFEAEFSQVTITSMYFALERFEIINHDKHLELMKKWRKYSRIYKINVYGKPKPQKSTETNTR